MKAGPGRPAAPRARLLELRLELCELSQAALEWRVRGEEAGDGHALGDRRGEEEGVEGLGPPEVLRGDLRDLSGHLDQGGGEHRRTSDEDGPRAVRRQLPVAGERSREQEADGIDDDRHQEDEQLDGGGVLVVPPVVAEQPGVEHDTGEEPGHHPEAARHGHDRDVAVGDVGELVGEDRLQLLLVEASHQPGRRAHHGRLGAPARGEGVGHVGLGNGDTGLWHVGEGAEPVDRAVQLGGLLGAHDPSAHGVEGDLVGEPVLREQQPQGDDHDEDERQPNGVQHGDEGAVEDDQEEPGEEHPGGEPPVVRDPASE